MNDLPPKSVNVQLVRLDDSLKRIERTQFAGIQRAPGSLPVLEAFQLFLENERKKARRRLLMLTTAALLLMVAAAAAGVALVQAQMRKAAAEFSRVSSRTDELAAVIAGAGKQSADDLTSLENRFREESLQIVAQYSAMLTEQASLADQVRSGGVTLETLQERLARLESENELLKTRLGLPSLLASTEVPVASADATSPVVAEPDTTLLDAPPLETGTEDETADAIEPDTAAPQPAVMVVEHPAALLLTIVPAGETQGIRWQLPKRFILE